MPRRHHLQTDCSSSSSSDNSCVPRNCDMDCGNCKSSSSSSCSSSSTSGYKGLTATCSSNSSSSSSDCDDLDYLCKPRKDLDHKIDHCEGRPKKHHKKHKKHHKKGCKGGCECDCDCDVADRVCPEIHDGCSSSSSSSECSSSCSSEVSIIVPDLGCEYGRKCEWTDKVKKDCCDSSSSDCHPKKHHGHKKGSKCDKCAYPHKHCKCHKVKGRTFEITYESKEGHPWQHRITTISSCIAVDGQKGPTIHLTRGHTYRFVVNPSGVLADQDFYFTHDVQGGPVGQCADSPTYDPVKLPGTSDPVASGTIYLHADWSLPKTFYYQSKMNRCCGGMVVIHDH